MSQYLPISLNITNRPCLVVGGGNVALQKAGVLRASGARVRVVAPWVSQALAVMAGVEIERREFREQDLEGVALVIAATDRPELNQAVYEAATRRGLLVNVVDEPVLCSFIFPSILRRGELSVAVSTGGASPSLARLLRQELEGNFHPDYGEILRLLRHYRREIRRLVNCPGARRALLETLSRWAREGRQGDPARLEARMEGLLRELSEPAPGEEDGSQEQNQGAQHAAA